MKSFIKHDYTKKDLLNLSKEYKYIVKANDKLLSGWGRCSAKKHIQLILCKDETEKDLVLKDCYNDKSLNYINWYPMNEYYYNNIIQLQYKYSVSLRNDWTRIYNK